MLPIFGMAQQIHLDTNVIDLGYFIQGSINTIEIPVHNAGQQNLEIKVKGNFRCWCEEKIIPKQSSGLIKCSIGNYLGPFRRVHYIYSNSLNDSVLGFYISGISFSDSVGLVAYQNKLAKEKETLRNEFLKDSMNQLPDSIDLSIESKNIVQTPKTRKRFVYQVTESYTVLDEEFPTGYKCNGYNQFSGFLYGSNMIVEGDYENCLFKTGKVYLYDSSDSLVRVNYYENSILTKEDSVVDADIYRSRKTFRNINKPRTAPKLKTKFTGKVEIERDDHISSGCGSAMLITSSNKYFIQSNQVDFENYEGKTITVYGNKREAVEGNVLCIEVKKITTANKK